MKSKTKNYLPYKVIVMCIVAPCYAYAGDIKQLEKGFYLPNTVGCDGIGGAAEIYFDGSNISGHYQLCRTEKKDENDNYTSKCIEAQGPDQPTMADIDKDPDKTTVNQRIVVKGSKSFMINKTIYNICRS